MSENEGYEDGGEGMKGLWKNGGWSGWTKTGYPLDTYCFCSSNCLTVGYILNAIGGRLKNITVFQYIIYF